MATRKSRILRKRDGWKALLISFVAFCTFMPTASNAQTTISTGSIVGTVSDSTGAVIAGANITIAHKSTGQVIHLTSTDSGTYNSGALTPGDYTVRVEMKGFQASELALTVAVGGTATGNAVLQIGSESTVVQVEASAETINTEQATLQSVITTQEIEQLPINGRNFLDLAQLQPGVQIQDGSNFDPTKNGFQSISFGGKFGRTARIEIDGVDISDENVGTTTQNVPASAIQEFQVESSSLDLSTELTSSGAVNITTRSGSNQYHGEAFGYGRWHNMAARIAPTDLFFRRQQFGGNFGGALKKDKLFFFLDAERTRQDLAAPVQLNAPFDKLSTSVNQPFKENLAMGRLDYQVTPGIHAFYRFTYNIHSDVVPFIPNTFSPFLNRDHSQDHAAGVDFATGTYTHSFRFGYLRFANLLSDATTGIFNPAPGLELGFGADSFCLTGGADFFCSGSNFLAPQVTQQHDLQFKYDGSKIIRSHVIRYGTTVNRLLGGGFASFLKLAPAVGDNFTAAEQTAAAGGPFPGGAGNPLNYPVDSVTLGNGVGFSTEIPQFGFPAGGQFDTRFSWYLGDDWKIKRNLTLTVGVHYVRDTGRSDADLAAIPAINQFGAGLGNRVHQPNLNFAPQVGLAWDPWKSGKTVVRAGAGIFYENTVWNNVLFDRPARLQKGLFLGFTGLNAAQTAAIIGQPIGSVANQIIAAQQQYQAATIAAGPANNGSFIGNTLADNQALSTGLFAPNFRTPYSIQLNGGIQRELRPGLVLSVDYVRNAGLHYIVWYDTNHVGDARYLEKNAALNAINTVNQQMGCAPGSAGIDCAIAAGATISNYARAGLDSGAAFLAAGQPAAVVGLTPDTGAAFPGVNPSVGQNYMLQPIGRSSYNGMDVSLRENIANPMPYVKHLTMQASYALSRYKAMVLDSDFGGSLADYANTDKYYGSNALDRTNQFSAGGVFELPSGLRLSLIAHANSALPVTLYVPPGPQREASTAQIFQSDISGDGTTGDPLPGTNLGSYGRTVNPGNINTFINSFNTKYAGQPTPAGQALIGAGLFTATQLQKLGAVAPQLAKAPAGQVGPGSLFTADLGLTWVWKLGENLSIQPSVTVFNLTNSQNFDFSNNILSGILSGGSGSANGTVYRQRTTKVTLGSGVYALGAPRVLEWGLKVVF